eukprot:2156763-Rhodomonas_salina.1
MMFQRCNYHRMPWRFDVCLNQKELGDAVFGVCSVPATVHPQIPVWDACPRVPGTRVPRVPGYVVAMAEIPMQSPGF